MKTARRSLNGAPEVRWADDAPALTSSTPSSKGAWAVSEPHSAEAVYLPEESVFTSADANSNLRSPRSNSAEEAFAVTLSALSRSVAISKSFDSSMGRIASRFTSSSFSSGSDADASISVLFADTSYPRADSPASRTDLDHLSECSRDSSTDRTEDSLPETTMPVGPAA